MAQKAVPDLDETSNDSSTHSLDTSDAPGGYMTDEDLALEHEKTHSSSQSPATSNGDSDMPRNAEQPESAGKSTTCDAPNTAADLSLSVSPTSSSPSNILRSTTALSIHTSSDSATPMITSSKEAHIIPSSSPPRGSMRNIPLPKSSPPPTPPARLTSSLGLGNQTSSGGKKRRLPGASSLNYANSTSSSSQMSGLSMDSPPSGSLKRSPPSMGSSSPPPAKQARLMASKSDRNGSHPTSSSSPPSTLSSPRRSSSSRSPPLRNGLDLTTGPKPASAGSPLTVSGDENPRSSPPLSLLPMAATESETQQPKPGPSSSRSQSPTAVDTELETRQKSPGPTDASTSSSSPSASPSSSSPLASSVKRRVKVYALYDSNWIPLGTGSCTFHRGVSHITRRKIVVGKGKGKAKEDADSVDPPTSSEHAGADPDSEYEEEQELIELDMDSFPVNSGRPLDGLEDNEEEASWIEVAKEGKWKTDGPLTSLSSQSDEEDEGEERTDGSDNDDGYERIWTTRLEKPDPTPDGLIDLSQYTVQLGSEDGEEVIGRYRRQQDSLIVWKPAQGDTDLALSFAATVGCAEVWEFLKIIHRRWHLEFLENSPANTLNRNGHPALDDEEEDDEDESVQALDRPYHTISPSSTFASAMGYGLGLGHLGANRGANQQSLLPNPTLSNLVEIDRTIKMISRTAAGREKLSTLVLRTNFLQKLLPVFHEAEDLESTPDLHTLCILLHSILNLNGQQLWDAVLGDELFLDLVSILEYDPDFPTMKASYREHLCNPDLYKEVVPIRDPETKLKIHQIYRMQYLKDVVLPRALDDSAFNVINSLIYFNQVDIVQFLNNSEGFWIELFSIFPASLEATSVKPVVNGAASDMEKQQDAIAFLQSYCQMLKQLQVAVRSQAFRALAERGLLRILAFCLTKMASKDHIRVVLVEILMLAIDNDTSSIRAYILKSHETVSKRKSLMHILIDCFLNEEELGIKSQLAEAIRVLVLPPGDAPPTETAATRTRADDPNADKFLQYFYEECVASLLEPITKGIVQVETGDILRLSSLQIALYTHLCDLLSFFVCQHSFRSKFFILSSSVTAKVAALLKARPKHLRLAALRYFRSCIGRNDDFYNRYLIKNDIFLPILVMSCAEMKGNNLLASACTEFFECIRLNNIKLIVNHLGDRYMSNLQEMSSEHAVFRGVIAKYEQNREPPPLEPSGNGPEDAVHGESALLTTSSDALLPETRHETGGLSTEEESYFASEDDEDDAVPSGDPLSAILGATSQRLERSHSAPISSKGIPQEEDRQEDTPLLSDISNIEKASTSPSLSVPATDPDEELAKIREKRKRAESEDEEEDLLALKKKSAASPAAPKPKDGSATSSNPIFIMGAGKKKNGAGGGVGANATGKIKLLFGKDA